MLLSNRTFVSFKARVKLNAMSRFVSGGTNEEPTERDEAWLKAQQEVEAKRQQQAEVEKQQDVKSLFETLQANKGEPLVTCVLPQTYSADESG